MNICRPLSFRLFHRCTHVYTYMYYVYAYVCTYAQIPNLLINIRLVHTHVKSNIHTSISSKLRGRFEMMNSCFRMLTFTHTHTYMYAHVSIDISKLRREVSKIKKCIYLFSYTHAHMHVCMRTNTYYHKFIHISELRDSRRLKNSQNRLFAHTYIYSCKHKTTRVGADCRVYLSVPSAAKKKANHDTVDWLR